MLNRPPLAALWGWLRSRPYTALGLALVVFLAFQFLSREDSEWEAVYVRAARHLWEGGDIYRPGDGNSYPPFATWAALPFATLPRLLVRLTWWLVNAVSLSVMFRAAWRLARGPVLEGRSAAPRGEHGAAILGALCGCFYLQNCLAHQQTDVVLGALLLGGCVLLDRDRSLSAAACFGLAAAVKCTALLWAPYLLWRRRPVAAAWLLAVAGGVNLLPDLVRPPASGRLWLAEYADRHLRPLAGSDHYVGTWGSDIVYNQSLSGAGQRWLVTSLDWAPTDCVIRFRPEAISPLALRATVSGAEIVLILMTLAVCRRPLRRVAAGEGGAVSRSAMEYSVVLLLMLLLSPMSSKAHFGTLILPGFCLARAAFAACRRWLWAVVAAAVVLAVVSNKDILGERLYTLSLWLGCVTWQTLLLLGGCLALLARDGENAALNGARTAAPAEGRRAA